MAPSGAGLMSHTFVSRGPLRPLRGSRFALSQPDAFGAGASSGKSATPPARCIHRPQRDTSSAGYRLLVSRASDGASRELSSRRSPALAPHTCAVSPTFLYGAFFFVTSALAAVPSARLVVGSHASTDWGGRRLAGAIATDR